MRRGDPGPNGLSRSSACLCKATSAAAAVPGASSTAAEAEASSAAAPKPKPSPPPPPPPPGWGCSAGNYTCSFGGVGGAKTKADCEKSCIMPPHKPGTPAALIGQWRGLALQAGYHYGEWDGMFNSSSFAFTDATGTLWEADVFTGGTTGAQLSFAFREGPLKGKTALAIYGLAPINCWAAAGGGGVDPSADKQAGWPDAEKGPDTMLIYLAKCGTAMTCAK